MAEHCGYVMRDFWAVPGIATPCGRPEGHAGDHHPVPVYGDPKDESDKTASEEG